MMFIAGIAAVVTTMVLALLRALLGPTLYDRILAVNLFGTKIVILIALFSFLAGEAYILDIALAYALINFIGTVAVLKFFEYGDLGRGRYEEEEL
ncbi:monovalent cation/H+ antiporter complex subunit F [Thiohalorhabdus sp. Cl-TMA]|uniref:Monovalent cation/H+ antiporter complex subunit F n=1 Tax=Thiohalorhabdus methylotrophus TaxID=3242694 RepID=A0ABV4TT84_9GAMM